jgi:predicted AAA+ superfamily ATPase
VKDRGLWFKGYEQTYLERDVRDLTRIGDLVAFRTLLRLAALRTAQVLKVSELARDAKINAKTASRHLSVMEASFVLTRLEPYVANRASRLIKSPKLHVADSGLAGYLWGVSELTDEADAGALIETYVAHNIRAIIDARWPEARLYYWHVQGRHEVDLVIEAGKDTLAVEVKSGSRWREQDLAGLQSFLEKTPRCRMALLAYQGEKVVQLGDRLWALPIGTLLS